MGNRNFFDSELVMHASDRGCVASLKKGGAFLRRTARQLLRPAKGPSKPGRPPHSHTQLLEDRIYFAYEGASEREVVGPAKTNQVFFNGDGQPVTGTVPGVLEHGGQIRILEVQIQHGRRKGQWKRADLRSKRRLAGMPTRLRTVTIAARPYMGAALIKEKQKLPAMFANSVKP